MKESIYPLYVTIDGGPSLAALMTPKGFSKSREQGTLWISHPETGRILPWTGEPVFLELTETDTGYTARLPEGSSSIPLNMKKDEVDVERHDHVELDDLSGNSAFLAKLTDTIQKRHKEMPEGSYTTHLFNKGMDKIKRKPVKRRLNCLLPRQSRTFFMNRPI